MLSFKRVIVYMCAHVNMFMKVPLEAREGVRPLGAGITGIYL